MSCFEEGTKVCIVKTDADLKRFVDAVVQRAISFFEKELQIKVGKANYTINEKNFINLKSVTSIIFIEDYLKMTIAFNYDDLLLNEIFKRYTKNIVIEEHETQLYIDETAGDLINNIIGNILSQFGQPNIAFGISTPVIIRGEDYVAKFKVIKVYTTKIKTEFGKMRIFCIIPGNISLNEFCS